MERRTPRRPVKRSFVTLTRLEARQIIESTNGKLFGVTFAKKNGDIRDMACRIGVAKGVKGTSERDRRLEDLQHGVMTVYDFNADFKQNNEKGGFRRINMSALKRIQFAGTECIVER